MTFRSAGLIAVASLTVVWAVFAATDTRPTMFFPDHTFAGSTLGGWHTLGQAKWRAENGEIVADTNAGGGWLMLDKSFQDVAFFASLRCAADCKTGILLRAEKVGSGYKGVYVSLAESDQAAYRLTLDARGVETSREQLAAGGRGGAAPPGGRGNGRGGGGLGPPGVTLPISRPTGGYRKGDWNQVEIILGMNSREQRFGTTVMPPTAAQLRAILNGANGPGGAVEDESGRYGAIALYAGGPGEIRFKDLSYKDLNTRVSPRAQIYRAAGDLLGANGEPLESVSDSQHAGICRGLYGGRLGRRVADAGRRRSSDSVCQSKGRKSPLGQI